MGRIHAARLPSVRLVKLGACARELIGALLAGVFCGVLELRLAMVTYGSGVRQERVMEVNRGATSVDDEKCKDVKEEK